jgi:hypothetical protein
MGLISDEMYEVRMEKKNCISSYGTVGFLAITLQTLVESLLYDLKCQTKLNILAMRLFSLEWYKMDDSVLPV